MQQTKQPLRALKAKLVMEDLDQKCIADILGRCDSYVSERVRGVRAFDTDDLRVLQKELNIDSPKEFLEIFMPGVKWRWEDAT